MKTENTPNGCQDDSLADSLAHSLIGRRHVAWWTGPRPGIDHCAGMDTDGVLRSLPQLRFENITRTEVLDYFNNTWLLTEVLFSALQGEEAFVRPPEHQLRHPLIFYYGHPACLYVNKLRVAGLLKAPVNADFERIFEVGVDEMSWDDISKNHMSWPAVSEVTAYRRTVYNLIKELILTHPDLDPQTQKLSSSKPIWALVMGFEHERIHLETSSVLMREMPLQFLRRPEHWPVIDLNGSGNDFVSRAAAAVKIEAGLVKIGRRLASIEGDDARFGWDNEFGQREVNVPAFAAGSDLVTNAEFLNFVKEGGYRDPALWSEHGWKWRSFRNTKAPTFWVPVGPAGLHEYKLRTVFEEVDFQPLWPAIVNYYEADAFCRWKTLQDRASIPYRLLTEAEHHRLRDNVQQEAPWNLGLKHSSEVSVGTFKSNGLSDVFGNVWQWCEDTFNPLPGFEAHPYYEDFSTPCFDGRHQMIMGGSFISTGDEAEPTARFHFRPHFFQHAGFRWVQGAEESSASTAFHPGQYESSELLSQYLLLHFAETKEVLLPSLKDRSVETALGFPRRCSQAVVEACHRLGVDLGKALDLGCAVGGASFALSEHFRQVVGVDLSASFISAAERIKKSEEISYFRKDQGELKTALKARLPLGSRVENLEFRVGDACAPEADLFGFDAVLLANLLCRLPDPLRCLQNMTDKRVGAPGLVRPGGVLVLVSPYSWLPEHTDPKNWLGARHVEGLPQESSAVIKKVLGSDFDLIEEGEMPLLIREHARKYQYIVSNLMIWQRRPQL